MLKILIKKFSLISGYLIIRMKRPFLVNLLLQIDVLF